jgi:diguanylate cyclase (GGDEF)-like protein/PAS domain S-box-containing protein
MIPSNRLRAIESKQTDQLFDRLKYSTLGSAIVALVMVLIIGPKTQQHLAIWSWFVAIFLVSFYRYYSSVVYNRLDESAKQQDNWSFRFKIGAYMAAVTWALPVWLFYPIGYPAYQVLMILGLAGVAGGALAILSYEKSILVGFLGIMLVGVISRLVMLGDELSYQLAVLSTLYFVFLMKGGKDIGDSYAELLELKEDTREHNLTLLSATERVARIGYWQWDMQSDQLELSANLAALCGVEERYVGLEYCLKNVHPDDRNRVQLAIDSVTKTGEESSVEYRLKKMDDDGWIIMNQVIKQISDRNNQKYLLGTVQDISVIKSAEQKIFDMAYYDELTGLANRGHFREQLSEQVKHAVRNDLKLAILYIDLDGFKEINDTLGHDQGDIYLRRFSRLLKEQVREEDFLARLGGDEFCIILNDVKDAVSAAKTAHRCLALENHTINIQQQDIVPQMSIGIAIYPQDGEDADSLLRSADAAMYAAKHQGKHHFAFYDAQMTEDASRRMELESELRKALQNREFKLVYQPKVSVESERISGVEALIRWIHPERGFIPPDEFIETAERIGLINDIGVWVLDTACRQLQQWKAGGLQLEMAINVSSSHFSSAGFIERVEQARKEFDIQPGELEIEITESVSRDPEQHIRVCKELHKNGIKVAIDDFGTGYSSLSVLKQLKVNTLKVDRAFIQNLPGDESSALMVRAIVAMAVGLGFDVVAEGVETLEQAQFLQQLGPLYIQGYYFSRPVEADQIPVLAKNTFNIIEYSEVG